MDALNDSLNAARDASAALTGRNQISAGSMTAFGITIVTRHNIARELRELLLFAELVAKAGAAYAVQSAFYDSNSCCCEFELAPTVRRDPQLADAIYACAMASISQFTWTDGAAHHGGPARDA